MRIRWQLFALTTAMVIGFCFLCELTTTNIDACDAAALSTQSSLCASVSGSQVTNPSDTQKANLWKAYPDDLMSVPDPVPWGHGDRYCDMPGGGKLWVNEGGSQLGADCGGPPVTAPKYNVFCTMPGGGRIFVHTPADEPTAQC